MLGTSCVVEKKSEHEAERLIFGLACTDARCILFYELPLDETVIGEAPSRKEPEPDN